jgi:hypothetical protein
MPNLRGLARPAISAMEAARFLPARRNDERTTALNTYHCDAYKTSYEGCHGHLYRLPDVLEFLKSLIGDGRLRPVICRTSTGSVQDR